MRKLLTWSFTLTPSMFRTLFWKWKQGNHEWCIFHFSFSNNWLSMQKSRILGVWVSVASPHLQSSLLSFLHQYCMSPPHFGLIWWSSPPSSGGLTPSPPLTSLHLSISLWHIPLNSASISSTAQPNGCAFHRSGVNSVSREPDAQKWTDLQLSSV